jgi:hypothetical protein
MVLSEGGEREMSLTLVRIVGSHAVVYYDKPLEQPLFKPDAAALGALDNKRGFLLAHFGHCVVKKFLNVAQHAILLRWRADLLD